MCRPARTARLTSPLTKPRQVSTWGVFPRPADISAAYGGGRNLKPGQTLETPEQEKVTPGAGVIHYLSL